MLASVSSNQPIIHGEQAPQHSFVNKKNNDELKEHKNTSESESNPTKKALKELTKEEQTKVQQLKKRDLEVKAHEQAHINTAGAFAIGGASFTYTLGPNGVRYAIGGEVNIDTSTVNGDPEATIRKADAIRRAALAPVSPSSQDQLVANKATTMSETARTELIQQTQEEQKSKEASTETEETNETDENELKNNNEINTASSSPDSPRGSLVDFSV